ncbi:MAG: MFP family transporter [Acidobacteria bacterium OLB17]|nr:MAG: MFP family transporter [Acidobacteria bacterium OLB17]MCZ2390872.1 HlyD family secretion protein [Acidobacteriota bacterium]
MSEESKNAEPESSDVAGEAEGSQELTEEIVLEKPDGKRRRIFIIGGSVLLVAVVAGFICWLYARQFESTDDAFIEADVVQISPKVSAYVEKVLVENNQLVHKGDLLVQLDTADLEVKLQKAKADLENAESQYSKAVANAALTKSSTSAVHAQASSNVATTKSLIEESRLAAASRRSQIEQAEAAVKTALAELSRARAQVAQPESDTNLAELEFSRREALFKKGDISRQSLDQARNALQNARSRYEAARKAVESANSRVNEARAGVATATENYRQSLASVNVGKAQLGESQGRLQQAETAPQQVDVSEAQVEAALAARSAAEAAVQQAELDLSYTKIIAPEDGYVTKKNVLVGQLVQVGAPLMALSRSNEVWVVANFKETQLEEMRVGQPVDIRVDAYPNERFTGKVESFQAGTGSRFSLLPPENASGNFVKVVQRLPVKIVFDSPPDKVHLLAPGMSVEPTVKVR